MLDVVQTESILSNPVGLINIMDIHDCSLSRTDLNFIHDKLCRTRMQLNERVLSLQRRNPKEIHLHIQVLRSSCFGKVERQATRGELFTVDKTNVVCPKHLILGTSRQPANHQRRSTNSKQLSRLELVS